MIMQTIAAKIITEPRKPRLSLLQADREYSAQKRKDSVRHSAGRKGRQTVPSIKAHIPTASLSRALIMTAIGISTDRVESGEWRVESEE